jgi:hypothetical protein
MSSRGITLGYLAVLLLACQAPSQVAKNRCGDAGTIAITVDLDDSYDSPPSVTLTYNLERPEKVSNVRIEGWDRPTLLFRTQVTKKKTGKVVWKPNENEQIPHTPFALRVKLSVPNDVIATERSRVLIGSAGPADDRASPNLLPDDVILQEGRGSTFVTAKGNDLGEQNTVILLMEEESPGVWIAREYLPATLVDLSHVGVEIPSGYLSKPTRLRLEAMSPGDDSEFTVGSRVDEGFFSRDFNQHNFITIYVMSKDRPAFSKIEPSVVEFEGEADVPARIFGSGFTAESRVLASFPALDDRYVLTPTFISDRELQLSIPSYLLAGRGGEPLGLLVRNGDDQHISDPQLLSVRRTPESDSAGANQPWIKSVSPYPVPLMDSSGPAGIFLKVLGENFTKDNGVIMDSGVLGPTAELKTRFISSQELTAWLPRDLWRSHQLFFKLLAQTSTGVCAAEVRKDR